MQAEKDNDGNRDMKIQRLLNKSHRVYDRNYPEGLLQYCHDIETIYEELKELNVEVAAGIKCFNLLGNFESVGTTETKFLTHHCRENFSTFDECLTHFKCTVVIQKDALEHSKRRANLTHIADDDSMPESNTDMETLSQLCLHASQDTSYENMRHIKNVISETKIRNPLLIQPEAWKLLVETSRRSGMQEYMDKRKAKEQGDKDSRNRSKPT